ncbi:hypothetical protein [Paenibacillus hunanensis]|uniref:Uncharacterized protein n=1 Tax=Paenibacillus hunanensis TaxID=539262 RepID=A0ABU1IV77_9BACL|nr:hypothetical protein [Paenibacillus hunanensis]MDR6243161.1 hypothetical protein [Paenibacillus hunanensis]GGJ11349.1 hypothetical protein GCM10008022_20640 [Paenibacillus hunanensis]
MLNANIVDHIGSKVTVWTKDGNAAENRQLHTVDEFGLVISNQDGKRTFIPWCQIKYVDYVDEENAQFTLDAAEAVAHAESLRDFTKKELFEELKCRTHRFNEIVEVGKDFNFSVRYRSKDGHLEGGKDNLSGPATIFIHKH